MKISRQTQIQIQFIPRGYSILLRIVILAENVNGHTVLDALKVDGNIRRNGKP